MAMTKLPFFKFFPNDWFGDPDLRKCSLEAKGLWMDLLCLMWKSETRGQLSGTTQQLARQVGQSEEILKSLISELELNNVLTVENSAEIKTLISRRIVKEEKLHGNKALRNKKYYEKNKSEAVKPPPRQKSAPKMSDGRLQMADIRSFKDTIVSLWNELPVPIPQITEISGQRLVHFKVRLNEPMFRDNLEAIITKIRASDFLSGRKGDWKITFDWLVKNSNNYLKILEGNYDNSVEEEWNFR